MNYKNLIKSENSRFKILKLFEFIPDRFMIQLQYFMKSGRIINLKKPKRFSEKLQWYKLYYRDSLMTKCADKYKVREYVSSKGLDDILIPLYGVYDNSEKINMEELPNSFVLKTNNGSHTNILCENKNELNEFHLKEKLNHWLFKRTAKAGREWAYYDIEPRIVCEEYLTTYNNELIDYKFICFNGKVNYVFVNAERESYNGMIFDIYDKEFNKLPYTRKGLRTNEVPLEKPEGYNRMIEIAEKLSSDFPHVRIDLYNISGKIYFGEMTFYHASGYIDFCPDEFDYIIGERFILDKIVK